MSLKEARPAEDAFIDICGGRLFVRRWTPEDDDGDPIVLLHDSLGCVRLWRDFPERLAAHLRRTVYAYDRLGFGESSARIEPPSPRFIEEEAQQVFPALCAALGLRRVVPFGHSVGGGMAIAIAGHHAQSGLCSAVITVAAQTSVEARTRQGIRAAKAQFNEPAQFAKLTRVHGDKAQWVLDAWTETWLSPAFDDWNLDQHLANVCCSSLVMHGDQDEFGSCDFPRHIASQVRGPSTLRILQGLGHVPHREDPEKILDLVAAFLDGVESPN